MVLLLLQARRRFLWRWLAKMVAVPPLRSEMIAMAMLSFALICFSSADFPPRLPGWKPTLLRPRRSSVGAYLCAISALACGGKGANSPGPIFTSRGLVWSASPRRNPRHWFEFIARA